MWPLSSSYPEVSPSEVDGKAYDYIVVGGGTAGCVVAARLSEDPNVSVLVLERGFVKDNLLSRSPLLSQNFFFGDTLQVVSDRFSEPSPEANGERLGLMTAEGLGGASRINGMVMTRGTPADYNGWAQELSLDDWAWDRVEPFFRKIENDSAHPNSYHRGHDGPVTTRQSRTPFAWGPYIEKAAQALGLPIVDDVNDPTAPAMGLYRLDQAVDKRSVRNTSYQAFLNKDVALKRRRHLTVCTGASATRLNLDENHTGAKGPPVVRGVFFEPTKRDNATSVYVEARREVIVCCGAFKTAQLLLLSGIGPRDQLAAHGIPVVRDLPVGESLADHFAFPIMLELPKRETMYMLQTAVIGLWHFLLWFVFKTGLMSSNCIASTIFIRSGAIDEKTMRIRVHQDEVNPHGPPTESGNDDHNGQSGDSTDNVTTTNTTSDNMDISLPRNIPDIEVMFFPVCGFKRQLPNRNLFTIYPTLVQPHSQGRVELADTNPRSHPRITHPLLRNPEDWPVARKAIRFAMRLALEFQRSGYPHPAPIAFAPGNELAALAEWEAKPGEVEKPLHRHEVKDRRQLQDTVVDVKATDKAQGKTWETVTDAEIDHYIRAVASVSLHPSCTCPMSNELESLLPPGTGRKGVVDQSLRVHGVRGLRIADTSVLPRMLSSHTMWPAMMVGERCADFIKRDWAQAESASGAAGISSSTHSDNNSNK